MNLARFSGAALLCGVFVVCGCGPDPDPGVLESVCKITPVEDIRLEEIDFMLTLTREEDSPQMFRGKLRVAADPFEYVDNRQRLSASSLDHLYYFGVEVQPDGEQTWTLISNTEGVTQDAASTTSHSSVSCGRRGGTVGGGVITLYPSELAGAFGQDVAPGAFEPLYVWDESGERFDAAKNDDFEGASSVTSVSVKLE